MHRSALGLAAVLLATASAAVAQDSPVYDGTGSYLARQSPPLNAADAARLETWKARKEVKGDKLKALERDAANGKFGAMANLATLMEQDTSAGPAERAAALGLYEKAAAGSSIGQRKLCVAYLLGEGRPIDYTKAKTFCTPLGAEDPVGSFAGAYDIDKGLSAPADPDGAITLYVKAVKLGSGDAADQLGQKALAASKPEAARRWFRQGVYLGSMDAMEHLAQLSESGLGGVKDDKEAYWLHVNAAHRGNAQAGQWVANLPADTKPLPRVTVDTAKTPLTNTYVDKDGQTQTEPFNLLKLSDVLKNSYPSRALKEKVEGYVTIHCYVNTAHDVDVCIQQQEYPLNFGFGRVISTLAGARLHTPDVNDHGDPLANAVFGFTLNWQIDR
jgi:TPR repeat protein